MVWSLLSLCFLPLALPAIPYAINIEMSIRFLPCGSPKHILLTHFSSFLSWCPSVTSKLTCPKLNTISSLNQILLLTLPIQWIASPPSWSWLRIFFWLIPSYAVDMFVVPKLDNFYSLRQDYLCGLWSFPIQGFKQSSSKPSEKIPCGGLIGKIHFYFLLDHVASASHLVMASSDSRQILGTLYHQLGQWAPELLWPATLPN